MDARRVTFEAACARFEIGEHGGTTGAAGAPIPLLLVGGYSRATFVTDQTAMLAAFTAIETTRLAAETARLTRDGIWYPMYLRLKQYRLAVQGRFATGAPLLGSLPALAPAAGHTPEAVNVSARWDASEQEAVITFTASADPLLSQYELRACFGATYKTDEEAVIGNLAAGQLPLVMQAEDGLVASGSKVFYRVYVVLTTGNEKGSRTVSVTRP
jgi:hypothetical protein